MSSDVSALTGGPMRERLTAAAARLVASGGAATLSVRRVASEAGTSTMSVYSQFGSMDALVDAVVDDGFDRLESRFVAIEPTDDPIGDLGRQTAAYVDHARENPELYAVMFGVARVGSHQAVTPDELAVGRAGTLDRVGATLQRAVEKKRLREAGGSALAFRWWTIAHGYAMLEGSGYVTREKGPIRILAPLLIDFVVGEGCPRRGAEQSIRRALDLPLP
ncbi:TetR/AcrR family transcriptional regulator [Nocardioides sp. WS12]|uniref:TetR/AcrR family transcriptional regulator n=1 Tax=Nocardioides sp. WS12 TaxID=2486272 RepID=UPI0015F8E2A6|nr:TetR/AcrR family transcriptional regulator [Nocardioides sp. WS12]